MKQRILHINLLFFLILILALILRIYRLPELMVFGGDVARDYLAARDITYQGIWPLLGSPSSVPWLHQGVFFTYVLSIVLFLGKYNPLAGGYFVAMAGVFSVWLVYFFTRQFFSQKTGLLAALLYATSPLVIVFDRYPYHQSLISLFTVLFFLFLFWSIKKRAIFFVLSAFVLSLLLQLELSNLVLLPVFIILIIDYRTRIKFKILFLSLIAFFIPWIPKIIYDIGTGFTQTLGLVAWILHKIIPLNYWADPLIPGLSIVARFEAMGDYLARIIFWPSLIFSVFFFVLAVYFLIKQFNFDFRTRKEKPQVYLILLWIIFPFLGFLIQGSPSEAYVPVVFALCAALTGFLTEKAIKINKFLFLIPTIIIIVNVYTLLKNDYFVLTGNNSFGEKYNLGQSFEIRKLMAKYIVTTSGEDDYNLVALGSYGYFPSSKLDLVYLTWYFGHEPSIKEQTLKYYVFNQGDNLQLSKAKTGKIKEFPYMVIATHKND